MEVRELSPKWPPAGQIPGVPVPSAGWRAGGVLPDYTERQLVTQTARCGRISHTRLNHLLSAAYGDHAKFCDAIGPNTGAGWHRGARGGMLDAGLWGQAMVRGTPPKHRYSTAPGQFRPSGSGSA